MSSAETEDMQRMLRDSAADYIARSDACAVVRAWRGKAPGFDRARWSEMAELGWLGVRLPERYGGAGLGLSEACVLVGELARGLAPEPVAAAAVLAARALLAGDHEGAKAELLGAIADGSRIVAVGWQESAGQMDVQDIDTVAWPDGAGFALTGEKDFVHGAAAADDFLISARAPTGLGLFRVPRDAEGLSIEIRHFTDGTPCGRLRLQDVAVPAAAIVASPGAGEAALEAALDEARVAASAEMLGVMRRSFDMTLDYLRQRKQFGKAIGAFQALQHRAVDLYVATEMTRSAIDRAVRTLQSDAEPGEKALAASACKARASDAALLVAKESIQMHGAIGYTDEHDIGLYVRRALKLSAWLGNGAQHRKRIAALSPALDLV